MINLDLGIGDFDSHKMIQFPDNSLKIILKEKQPDFVEISLKSSDDILTLLLLDEVLTFNKIKTSLYIKYMMYQQDDRRFDDLESFGLKAISKLINACKSFENIVIFSPHSDKVEMINNLRIQDNTIFIEWVLNQQKGVWVIPDGGALKSQQKQIEKLNVESVTCLKTRNHRTGEIKTFCYTDDLEGKDCIIFDDICLGGNTFIQIAKELKSKNCGKLYLAISHGVFNRGVEHLYEYFDCVYTTNSINSLVETEKLKIYQL